MLIKIFLLEINIQLPIFLHYNLMHFYLIKD